MNRHERRRALVFEQRQASEADVSSSGAICAWNGCLETFRGDMPNGWTWLLMYWNKQPLLKYTGADTLRDAALCPAHTRALDLQLKDLGRQLDRPLGSA